MQCGAPRRRRFACFALIVATLAAERVSAEIGDLSADSVLGQATFTDQTALSIDARSIGKPAGIAVDRLRNRVYVSDSLNHRVLGWSNASTLYDGAPADIVIGQPDFVSWGCNRSLDGSKMPVTMDSLCGPAGLAVDSAGNLYVADADNCRVLVFDDPYASDTVADRALGQADGSCNGTIVNAGRLALPSAVAVDGAGNVYVTEASCRVLEFDGPLASTDATADRVYGQPDFTSRYCSTLYFPKSVAIDGAGTLWVGSQAYVYAFDDALGGGSVRAQPTRQLGSGTCNPNGESASSTCFPTGVATDTSNRLYVADSLNSRILRYDTPTTVSQAAAVLGQPTFGPPAGGTTFCGNESCNNGGPSASSLCLHNYRGSYVSCGIYWASAIATDGADNVWVADGFNNRVLRYDTPAASDRVADLVLGQQSMSAIASPVVPLDAPTIALSQWNYQAVAIDTNNSRLLVYGNFGKYGDGKPIAILGQPDVASHGCNTGGISARSICNPTAAHVASGGDLWIADTGNNRVLRFDAPWLTWDYANRKYTLKRDADAVFGQPDFTSAACRPGATGLCGPRGLATDPHGNLYVSDTGNNRVVVDQNPLTTDRAFEVVYGQPDFNSTSCKAGAGGASALCDPRGITVLSHIDAWGIDQGDDLYVADRGNHRVLLYRSVIEKPSGAAADTVFGQGDNMSSAVCRRGADGLCAPSGVATDRGGNLLVADTNNNRVLVYENPLEDTVADRVFGQPNFESGGCNAGAGQAAPAANTLCVPEGIATSGSYEGNVFVGDTGNNRIVRFEAPYCIESFSLTAANRRTKGLRSKPMKTRIRITPGTDPSQADDTLEIRDKIVLLEQDGGVDPGDPPLFTLATDATFETGVAYKDSVPPWISNVRATDNGGLWSTDDLELDRGITFYEVKESFYIPPGFGDEPQRDNLTYKALAVGQDLSSFADSSAWFRAQFGSTCFTTEMLCKAGTQKLCRVAPPLR